MQPPQDSPLEPPEPLPPDDTPLTAPDAPQLPESVPTDPFVAPAYAFVPAEAPPLPVTSAPVVQAIPAVPPPPPEKRSVVEADPAPDDSDPISAERPIDPMLLYLGLVALTLLGLRPLAPDILYTLVWVLMIVIGVLSMLYDHLEVELPTAGDMALGFGFGVILSVPLLTLSPLVTGLRNASLLMFPRASDAFALQSLVVVMPAAEALLFRGAIQTTRGVLFAVGSATLWSVVLFFPQLKVAEQPAVGLAIGVFFLLAHIIYSYLKVRFGLWASWTCQIAVNVLLLFATRIAG